MKKQMVYGQGKRGGVIANSSGYTLIELMMVVAVVAILAAFAYPSYMEQVRQTHRKDAVGEVLDIAAHLERLKSQSFSYAAADNETRTLDRYTLSVAVPDDDPTSYTITATPTGAQVGEPCSPFSYTNDSNWTFSNDLTKDDCLN